MSPLSTHTPRYSDYKAGECGFSAWYPIWEDELPRANFSIVSCLSAAQNCSADFLIFRGNSSSLWHSGDLYALPTSKENKSAIDDCLLHCVPSTPPIGVFRAGSGGVMEAGKVKQVVLLGLVAAACSVLLTL